MSNVKSNMALNLIIIFTSVSGLVFPVLYWKGYVGVSILDLIPYLELNDTATFFLGGVSYLLSFAFLTGCIQRLKLIKTYGGLNEAYDAERQAYEEQFETLGVVDSVSFDSGSFWVAPSIIFNTKNGVYRCRGKSNAFEGKCSLKRFGKKILVVDDIGTHEVEII